MSDVTLAIIGTAGRKEDKQKLTSYIWEEMCRKAELLCKKLESELGPIALVSGGAAWADHVAVAMHCWRPADRPLTLWFPEKEKDLETARHYHKHFSEMIGRDTWSEFDELVATKHHFGGFLDRNKRVAESATHYLAMTFGDGPNVKDGGTSHTVSLMNERGVPGWHLDLNTLKIYKSIL
jgi:hypothetical protein